MSATPEDVGLFEAYTLAVNHPELKQPRRSVCQTLSTQLAACGDRLWAFGIGDPDFRMALSIAVQFGGSLATGAVTLAESENWYAAAALVRQLIEVEYLVRLFRRQPEQAGGWLRSSQAELQVQFKPCAMRKRLGDFRHEEYRAHCQLGGHPNPKAHFLLPGRVHPKHLGPFASNEDFWIDLAQHLRRLWRDIEAIPSEHPSLRLEVILQYMGVVNDAIRRWEELDPCSRMIPEALFGELVAGRASPSAIGAADRADDC